MKYQVSFKNRFATVDTIEEALKLCDKWTRGYPRRMVQREFKITEIS